MVDPSTHHNVLVRAVQRHYSSPTYHRSQQLIDRERFFICSRFPFNRWLLLPFSVLIQFCCGSLYAWSVYNVPIEKAAGWGPNTAQITFYLAVGFFGLSAAIMGPWLERNGPHKAALIGSTAYFIGAMGAALAVWKSQLWLLYISFGVIGGAGLGLSYISPVSCLQKWFPDHRGLASGFAVCGFGAGSIVAAPLQKLLLSDSSHIGVPLTFIILNSSYFIIMFLSSFILRNPPPDYIVNGMNSDRDQSLLKSSTSTLHNIDITTTAATTTTTTLTHIQDDKLNPITTTIPTRIKLSLIKSIQSRDYHLMYLMFFANSIAGLVVLGKLSEIVEKLFNKSANEASTIVSINGGFNLAGRIGFSLISDRIGRKITSQFIITIQVICLALLPTFIQHQNYNGFLGSIWMLAASYGAGFGVIPAFLADMFGSQNIGALHGIILTGWAIAGVGGGLLFTYLLNTLKTQGYSLQRIYMINFYWLLAIAILGWCLTPFITTRVLDRLLPRREGEWMRLRAGHRLIRAGRFGVFVVNDEAIVREYREKRLEV